MIISLLLCPAALAATLLSPTGSYPVKKELVAPAPAIHHADSVYSEVVVDFESFEDPNTTTPQVTTHSDQLLKSRRLPSPDPKTKDPYPVRTELTYERMLSNSVIQVPVLGAYRTNVDLGTILSSHPIFLRGDETGAKKVDNLLEVKGIAMAQTKDLATRNTINMLLSDDLMLKASNANKDRSCLDALPGKKPGEKWKTSASDQTIAIDYDCTFEGWAEVGAQKVLVMKVIANKQKAARPLPDGTAGVAETEGEGDVILVPESGEAVMRMSTRIFQEPNADAVKQIEAKGQPVKRTHSKMQFRSHVYPI